MGIAWLFGRRRKPKSQPAADPAEELKQKLAESRAEEPEPPADAPAAERAVHDRARASIDQMRGRGTTPGA
jgi:hypothetical protein